MSLKKVTDAIRSLANARGLQFECGKVLVLVLMYSNKTMIWIWKKEGV